MDYPLFVHINQTPSDVFKLQQSRYRSWQSGHTGFQMRTYKPQPVRLCVRLHKLVDVTICHPL